MSHIEIDPQPILMLAYYFPLQNTSGADRPFRFAKYLPQHGYQPWVIAAGGFETPPGWDNVRRVPGPAGPLTREAVVSKAANILQRFLLPYEEHLPWVPYAVGEAARVLKARKIGAVVSTSPPIATHLAALELKRHYGLKWIADFRDPLFGNPFRSDKRAVAYDEALERCIFRHADAIIANTSTAAESWQARYPRYARKVTVIWNGFDPGEKLGAAPIPARPHVVLAHVGNIYGGRDAGILLASLERLVGSGAVNPARFRVRLVGLLDEQTVPVGRPPFRTLVEKGCLEYANRLVPQAQAKREMAEADYLLLIDTNAHNTGLQVPAKLFDYIRVGRPILALTTQNSPAEQILARSGIPHRCIYSDSSPAQADAQLRDFLQVPSEARVASRWFWNHFDGATQAGTLSSLLRSLHNGNHHQN
jgi:glycosyltransferase involved in cell wall biosynthesis